LDSTPQFGTAEYNSSPSQDSCKGCHQPISGAYYQANSAMLCGSCVENLRRQIPQDTHAAFVRGIAFGVGGFVLGLILYAGFTILTGIEIGFVSLAVGWLVGKAIMIGSRGVGGRRYQIAGVLLTYAAVSMAFVPIVLHSMRSNPDKVPGHKTAVMTPDEPKTQADAPASQIQPDGDSGAQAQAVSPTAPVASPPSVKDSGMNFWKAMGTLALLGLASPFLQLSSGMSGLIGLFILFIGMQFAWKMTRGVHLAITGPYQASASAKA
jgi:hypothetical protein